MQSVWTHSIIRTHYPGLAPHLQAKHAIKLAAKYNGVAGAISATVITGLEISIPKTVGADLPVAVPAIGAAIMADVGYTTRAQLRTVYDLSVIHGAPLDATDVEDCLLIFLLALNVKLVEGLGDIAKAVGPRVVQYNARKLLRSGVRKAIVQAVTKAAGTQVGRKLTERAILRLLVPGISVPIASSFNYYSTKRLLAKADLFMARRGAVAKPLKDLTAGQRVLDNQDLIKAVLSFVQVASNYDWSQKQVDGLRYCQATLKLIDEEIAALENWLDRQWQTTAAALPRVPADQHQNLLALLIFFAAMADKEDYDKIYAERLSLLCKIQEIPFDPREGSRRIREVRSTLAA